MKTMFCCIAFMVIIFFSACSKSTDSTLTHSVNVIHYILINRVWSAARTDTTYPQKDSLVTLQLNSDDTYQSWLNNVLICKGNYSISNNIGSYYQKTLKLQNLATTGIFAPLVLYQVNANQQVVSIDTAGFFMNISHDTLTLIPDAAIPAGQETYTFVQQ